MSATATRSQASIVKDPTIGEQIKKKIKSGLHFLHKYPTFTVGLVMILIILFIAVFAEQLAPHDPYRGVPKDRLLPPFWHPDSNPEFILGTDYIGRDLLSRIMVGVQTSMIISICAVMGAVVLGGAVGIISGLSHPGIVDSVLMRITDIQMGVPFIVLVIIIVSLVTPTVGSCIVVLTLSTWTGYARSVRSSVMLEKEIDYVAAAKTMGASKWRIAYKYLGRNLLPGIIPNVPMDISGAIITESLLSFMALGIQPPLISLGNIMGDGRSYISTSWWITALPGFVIIIIVVGLTLMGDALQVHFDPQLRKK